MELSTTRTFQPGDSPKEAIPYTSEALRQDLQRVRDAWDDCQATRDRNAIYAYIWAGRLVRRRHSVHRRSGQSRQAYSEQVVPGHALRSGVQGGLRAAGAIRQTEGRDQ
jgi:hypothetical protein